MNENILKKTQRTIDDRIEKRIKLVQELTTMQANLFKRMTSEFQSMTGQIDEKMKELSVMGREYE